MSAVFLTTDLIFASRVQSAAKSAGVELRVVGTPAALFEQMKSQAARLVILDLTAANCDPQQLVPRLREFARVPWVLAYAPHVLESRLAAARQAGCDQVLTRGQFHGRVDEILGRLAEPPGTDGT